MARASFPPVSWDVVSRYFHAANPRGTFTEEQIAFIAANHRLVCLEKKHGFGEYGNSQDAFTIDAARIKAKNPAARVLFYVNTIIACRFFKEDAELTKNPQWLVHDKKGKIVQKEQWRVVRDEQGKNLSERVLTDATYLDGWKLRSGVALKEVTLETLSQEVVIGLMGVSVMAGE